MREFVIEYAFVVMVGVTFIITFSSFVYLSREDIMELVGGKKRKKKKKR
jgi:hypothetical protein